MLFSNAKFYLNNASLKEQRNEINEIDFYKASFISGYAAPLCSLKLSSLHHKTLRLKIF